MPREADNRGNITSETRNGVTVTYEYDELGQLIRVNDPGDPAADSDSGTTWLFTYDRGGNILSKQAYVLSTAAQPTELRQNLIYGYTDANWKDKLTHFCNDELTYDAIGNLTSDTKWTYTWEKGRQLKSMHNAASGVTMEFKYNHNGLRTRKVKKVNDTITETTDYILKGKHIAAMKKNTDTYYFTYDASGKPATVTYNGVKYTYVKNLQGDIVGILDSTGSLVIEYRYDAWGAPTSILCVNIACDDLAFDNPFRYRGYVWDEETELYYLRSRYYKPEWGRFLNADNYTGEIGNILSHSFYSYCRNSVINRFDQNGRADEFAIFVGNIFRDISDGVREAISAIAGYNDIIPDYNFEVTSVEWNDGYSTEEAEKHNGIVEAAISGIYDINSFIVGLGIPTNSYLKKFVDGACGYIAGKFLNQRIQGYFNDLFEVRSGAYLSIKCRNTRKFKIFWIFEGVATYDYEWRIYGGGHELWMQYTYSGWGYELTPWYKVGEMTHSEFKNILGE